MHNQFAQCVYRKLMNLAKVKYGIIDKEAGRRLLGDQAAIYLEKIASLGDQDFDLVLDTGNDEKELKSLMREWLPLGINSREMRVSDAMKAVMAKDSDVSAKLLEKGWDAVKKAQENEAKINNENNAKINEANIQDRDKERKFELILKSMDYLMKSGALTQEALNQYAQFMTEQQAGMQPQQL